MSFNWTCPYCDRAQTVVDNQRSTDTKPIGVSGLAEGTIVLQRTTIGCANEECKRLTLNVVVAVDKGLQQGWHVDYANVLLNQRLLPPAAGKPQPDYIPPPIVEDYQEACLIRELSPKASATLARRCIQGMIRDFCGISRRRLIDEIKELKKSVEDGSADRSISLEAVTAIDHVRSLGNIGAHMEADIDHIVPVDSGEAMVLIELIELLFEEWYGARHSRQIKLAKLESIRIEKDDLKQLPPPTETQTEVGSPS